ncbi:Rieske (2Fe-2S) protein [Planosporangium sp. 12N6]|uniref:Rieske (2Fe-2S) protein n=1 Tax=Planosporangium spinosum TaxID=3402278 RepID=UPI003CE7413B
MSDTTRRSVLAGAAGIGAAAVLAACGTDDAESSGSGVNGGTNGNAGQAAPTTPGQQTGGQPAGGTALAKTSEIPVGGGKIFKDKDIVITQPTAGQFKAFSATCTHQGCPVTTVANGTINCNCHNSKFSVSDGSVTGGPAKAPLEAKNVTVQGDSVTLA